MSPTVHLLYLEREREIEREREREIRDERERETRREGPGSCMGIYKFVVEEEMVVL